MALVTHAYRERSGVVEVMARRFAVSSSSGQLGVLLDLHPAHFPRSRDERIHAYDNARAGRCRMTPHRHTIDLHNAQTDMATVHPVPCEHIADYYTHRWQNHKCIAFNLLRRGYGQWSRGHVEAFNNLFGEAP